MDLINEEKPFIIDLSEFKNASEVIHHLGFCLESPISANQKIYLKLGEVDLNQSQLLSIKSLINSVKSELSYIRTASSQTELAGLNMGIIIEKMTPEVIEQINMEFTQPTPIEKIEEEIEEIIEEEPYKPHQIESLAKDFTQANYDEQFKQKTIEEETTEETKFEPMADIHSPEVDHLFTPIEEQTKFEESPVLPSVEEMKNKDENEIKTYEYSINEIKDETEVFVENNETTQIYADPTQTMYIRQTLRSGQIINYDGHVIVVGNAHPGSEIKATGDITVWGILGGIAHAGALGNNDSRIRALKMNPIQLRIGNYYARRPDGSNIPYYGKTDVFTPEEARIANNEIIIYKMNNEELKGA